ncbi:hypothetical protein AOLI_G00310360 [Acnodon oligacanthus]
MKGIGQASEPGQNEPARPERGLRSDLILSTLIVRQAWLRVSSLTSTHRSSTASSRPGSSVLRWIIIFPHSQPTLRSGSRKPAGLFLNAQV